MKTLTVLFSLLVFAPPASALFDQRVGLCGQVIANRGGYVLYADNLPPIRLLGVAADQISAKTSGACMIGPERPLPTGLDRMHAFTVRRIVFHGLVVPFMQNGYLMPFKACGPVGREGSEFFIQYGPALEQKVYATGGRTLRLRRSQEIACFHSRGLPQHNANGRLELDVEYLTYDSDRSGFSVGNL